MNPFALLISLCGLSHRESAEFLDVRVDTVRSWSVGRNRAPSGVIQQLSDLHRQQVRAADENTAMLSELAAVHGLPGIIELSLSSDDYEAGLKGWPCVGAERQSYAYLIARHPDRQFKVVPRGSTPATAAAADAHEKTPPPGEG